MENTTTTDWPTGSSDHAASNVKTATIIQFVPRANPNRDVACQLDAVASMHGQQVQQDAYLAALQSQDPLHQPNFIGHPWSGEDKA